MQTCERRRERVGQPQLTPLDDSRDGQTRWAQLRVEVAEGTPYRVGEFTFDGNVVLSSEKLRPLFQLNTGDTYRRERVVKGLERAREIYGAGGYFEFTAFPDLRPRDDGSNVVDVVMRISEGKQYFVNRIHFTGNTHTRDEVIRREVAVVEGGVFDTELLKHSLRRIDQLGYFKPLEERALDVQRLSSGADRNTQSMPHQAAKLKRSYRPPTS